MILWSIQHELAYEKMRQTGVLRADRNFILEGGFGNSYQWMTEQMKKRIGEPPEGVLFPVWAWYQWDGKRKRPDMRVHGRGWCRTGTIIERNTRLCNRRRLVQNRYSYCFTNHRSCG